MSLESGLFFTCEHGGNVVPLAFRALFAEQGALLASHRGHDPGALALARYLAQRLDAPLEYTRVTRLLVECNRSPNHPQLFSTTSRRLDSRTRQDVLERYYHPYRRQVEQRIRSLQSRGIPVLHVSVHSFTPVLDGKVRRVDIGLLYDPEREGERIFCLAWQRRLQQLLPAMRIRRNLPYRGTSDGLIPNLRTRFAEPGYLGFEIEVNQAITTGPRRRRRRMRDALLASLQDLHTLPRP